MALGLGKSSAHRESVTTRVLGYVAPSARQRATTLRVSCPSDSANPLGVDIPTLHPQSEPVVIDPGETEFFRVNDRGIAQVYFRSMGTEGDESSLVTFGAVCWTGSPGVDQG